MTTIWHDTPDAPRPPRRAPAGQPVPIPIGTWPIELGQTVWVSYRAEHADGRAEEGRAEARWQRNEGPNSYWRAILGPFPAGTRVAYTIAGHAPTGEPARSAAPAAGWSFGVGPRLYLAILWHHHQPLYRDLARHDPRGSLSLPWARLHALRDYAPMALRLARHPDLHATVNLTPSLLQQIQAYLDGATDRALELTLRPAEELTPTERREILATFFDAPTHTGILPHPRYRELLERRHARRPFRPRELRDLQMWFNLAWFGTEFRHDDVALPTGESASVRRFVERGRDFSHDDLQAMVAEQHKILRAVVPLHRELERRGQIELSTTPFYHPILPLLVDTDHATLDRPGARLPARFARPEDADAQTRLATLHHTHTFGRPPRGVWPAEAALSDPAAAILARHGARWTASDAGVLQRSGPAGHDTTSPDVLCRPYAGPDRIAIFFRDPALSNAIAFDTTGRPDPHAAARAWIAQLHARITRRLDTEEDRILTIALDGDNTWDHDPDGGHAFLDALYHLLTHEPEIQTVTPAEYLDGNPARGVPPHPPDTLPPATPLFPASWSDEPGSAPGVDLGSWIGEEDENRAWELLRHTRDTLDLAGARPDTHPAAFQAIYAAEGSDWFWWLGTDHDSAADSRFEALFRTHLRAAHSALGRRPPAT
ncbi:MAG TPA: glycoside hydrolase family 57 protein, partial [Gemmatimonadales bacterium]|nr:glycoside hydrolase family 57 protein [Gemmatimonadales bacterium]